MPSVKPRGGNRTADHNAVARAIRQYIEWHHGYQVKILGGIGQRDGIPDYLACLNGKFIAVEVKTGKAVLNPAQERERDAINAAGGIWILAHTVQDVEDALASAGLVERSLT